MEMYKFRFDVDGESRTEDVIWKGDDPRPQAIEMLNSRSAGTGELLKWCGSHWGTLERFHDGEIVPRNPPT